MNHSHFFPVLCSLSLFALAWGMKVKVQNQKGWLELTNLRLTIGRKKKPWLTEMIYPMTIIYLISKEIFIIYTYIWKEMHRISSEPSFFKCFLCIYQFCFSGKECVKAQHHKRFRIILFLIYSQYIIPLSVILLKFCFLQWFPSTH